MRIFQNYIKTRSGRSTINIVDKNPDKLTPDRTHRGEIHGGITLEQGDSGSSSDGLPKSKGSFFNLTFSDTNTREFQKLFSNIGDETRFKVQLDIPGFGIWRGYVKRELQQRPLGTRNTEDRVTVTCYDGLGRLKDIQKIQKAFDLTIREFLVQSLALANPDVPIKLYVDIAGNSKNEADTNKARTDRLYPIEETSNVFAPWTGEYEGLEGSTVREQLDQLCKKLHSTCFYDLAYGGWKFIDIAAVGEGIDSEVYEYNGKDWIGSSLKRREVDIDKEPSKIIGDNNLEKLPATREACFTIENWVQDPRQEQYDADGTDTLYFYPGHTAYVQRTTKDDNETYSDVTFESNSDYVDNYNYLDFDVADITHIRVKGEFANTDQDVMQVNADIDYGDGTTDSINNVSIGGGFDEFNAYFKVDESKDILQRFDFRVITDGSQNEAMFRLAVQMLTSVEETKPDGTTETVYKVVDTVCYRDKGSTGKKYEGEKHSLIVEESNGSKASSEEFISNRYQNVSFLARWKAINIVSLQTSETEKLKARITPDIIPLGHKIRYTKPDETQKSHFVHLDSRVLHLGTSELDQGTKLSEMQVPNSVVQAIPNTV